MYPYQLLNFHSSIEINGNRNKGGNNYGNGSNILSGYSLKRLDQLLTLDRISGK